MFIISEFGCTCQYIYLSIYRSLHLDCASRCLKDDQCLFLIVSQTSTKNGLCALYDEKIDECRFENLPQKDAAQLNVISVMAKETEEISLPSLPGGGSIETTTSGDIGGSLIQTIINCNDDLHFTLPNFPACTEEQKVPHAALKLTDGRIMIMTEVRY